MKGLLMHQTNLDSLAEEMKERAIAMPITQKAMMEVVDSGVFPEELQRNVDVGFGPMNVQFSHDILSNFRIKHLSFARKDMITPSEEMQEAFRKAFFNMATKMGNPFNPGQN